MKYKHLEFDEILHFLEESKELDFNYIVLILVNGDHLFGRLDKYSDAAKNNEICLSHYRGAINYEFFIPFSDIAGILISNITEKTEEVDRNNDIDDDIFLDSKVIDQLIEKSKKYNYRTDSSFLQLSISSRVLIPKGITSNKTYALLHCNLDYLTRNRKLFVSGGGISVFGIGISISRNEKPKDSLLNIIEHIFCKKTKLRIPISENMACQTGVITEGFIQFAEVNGKLQTIEMENKTWVLIYISTKKVNDLQELLKTDWCLGAISDKYSIIPFENLDNVDTPISFYGDIVPTRFETEIGEINKLIKIEAAAIVPK